MRICVLSFSYPRWDGDDAGVFVARLLRALSEKGVSGTVIAPYDKGLPLEDNRGAFVVRRVKYGILRSGALAYGAGIMPNLRRDPSLILQAPSLLSAMSIAALKISEKTDLVYANWIPSPLIGHLLKTTRGIPYVVSVRGEDMRLMRGGLITSLLAPSLRAAHSVVSVNESFAEKLTPLMKGSSTRIVTIGNGIDVPEIPETERATTVARFGINGSLPFALFLGSVIPRKRLDLLLRAMTRSEWPRDLPLVIAGRCDEPTYKANLDRYIHEHQLGSKVHFLGQVPARDAAALLRSAVMYLSASEFEGRSNSILEAMFVSLPVVASAIDAHREVIQHGENGYLFEEENSLALRVGELYATPSLRKSLGHAASEKAAQTTWSQCADQYLELFRSAARKT